MLRLWCSTSNRNAWLSPERARETAAASLSSIDNIRRDPWKAVSSGSQELFWSDNPVNPVILSREERRQDNGINRISIVVSPALPLYRGFGQIILSILLTCQKEGSCVRNKVEIPA